MGRTSTPAYGPRVMNTSMGIEYGTHGLSEEDGSNGFHLVNLTLGEVETIRRALHRDKCRNAAVLAMALDRAMMDEPRALDYHGFVETPIEQL